MEMKDTDEADGAEEWRAVLADGAIVGPATFVRDLP